MTGDYSSIPSEPSQYSAYLHHSVYIPPIAMLLLGEGGVEKREDWVLYIVRALSYDTLGSSQGAAVTSLHEAFVTSLKNQFH